MNCLCENKTDIISFMAYACLYAKNHIFNLNDHNKDNLEYLFQCTSHQIACFLAHHTKDGCEGVEWEIVLEELCSKEISTIEEWKSIIKTKVNLFGGLK